MAGLFFCVLNCRISLPVSANILKSKHYSQFCNFPLQAKFYYCYYDDYDMKKIVEKHPLSIRWFHWINFPILSIMIWSGILIYWANDIYRIGFGQTTLL